MAQIEGKYVNEKNENIDGYFKAVGVPYVARKMMCASRPSLEIARNEDEFSITISTLFRTATAQFKLGEEYEEQMPGGTLKNLTVMEGDKLITKSKGPGDEHTSRLYEFSDDQCIITYTHEKSGQVAKRFYKRT